MAAAKAKNKDISPDNSPADNAQNGVDILQQMLDQFVAKNPPVAAMPNAADIKAQVPGTPPTPPVVTPEATAKQPEKAAAQSPAVAATQSVVNAILNQGQLIKTPDKGSSGSSGGGLNDIIGKLSGGSSGTKGGGLGQVGAAISGITKLAGMFGI